MQKLINIIVLLRGDTTNRTASFGGATMSNFASGIMQALLTSTC